MSSAAARQTDNVFDEEWQWTIKMVYQHGKLDKPWLNLLSTHVIEKTMTEGRRIEFNKMKKINLDTNIFWEYVN